MSSGVSSWPVVSLFDVCNPKQWPTIPQTAFVEHGYPVYGANGQIGRYTEFNHEKPTVLITCRGATCGTINVCEPKSYVTGNAMALDDLDESRVSAEYLVYALRSGSLAQAISGTAQPQITRQSLTAISIPLPPLAEQRRIAEVLHQAEALRANRRAALAQLDSLTQSIFLDMFGDPTTNPKGWEVRKVVDLIKDGPTNGLYKPSSEIGDGVLLLDNKGLYRGLTADFSAPRRVRVTKQELLKYELKEGDVIFNRVSVKPEGVGKAVWVDRLLEPSVYESNMMRVRFIESILPEFVVHLLALPQMRARTISLSNLANQASINQEIVKGFSILFPPLDAQRRFVASVIKIRALREIMSLSLEMMNTLFQSLQHRAFRGELL